VYSDGSKGARCASSVDPKKWFCLGKLQTGECVEGYVCTGPPDYQCVLSGVPGEGTPDRSACIDGCQELSKWKCDIKNTQCVVCTSADDPTKCTDKQSCDDACVDVATYKCNHKTNMCEQCPAGGLSCSGKSECEEDCKASFECVIPSDASDPTKQPQCIPCSDPTGQRCAFATLDECSKGDGQTTFGCDWQYRCEYGASGPTCEKTAHGIPRKEWCLDQCTAYYSCDDTAQVCKQVNQSTPYKNITDCNNECPTQATNSTPYELRGVWRGYAIQKGFGYGEWVANITVNTTKVIKPDGSTYFSGATKTFKPVTAGAIAQLWVTSTEGDLTGPIKLIYNNFDLSPELGYVALAVDEKNLAIPPKSYDAAMTAPDNKVLGMYKCASPNCKFHLPGPTPILGNHLDIPAVTAYSDSCNAYGTCKECIAATSGSITCGWCTQPVEYVNATSPSSYQCAGWEAGQSHPWKCYGQFRIATCVDYCCDTATGTCKECDEHHTGYPTKGICDASCQSGPKWYNCSFDGSYRGLEVDLGYIPGEWAAHFQKNTSHAKFEFLPTGYEYEGDIKCRPTPSGQDGSFKLTLTNGTVLYGIYADGDVQAETAGLSWAISELGATLPPVSWDAAMLGLNATVYGYTKCADWKAQYCVFP